MRTSCALALGLVTIAIAIYLFHTESFRSEDKKNAIAETLVRSGEPQYKTLKDMGLDGAESWSVRQLWHQGKWSRDRIAGML